MNQKLSDKIRQLIESGRVDGVLGLKRQHGAVTPFLFKKIEDVKDVELKPKYSTALILRLIQGRYPSARFGAVCRGCDERALIELSKRNQVNLENLLLIGLACSKEEAEACNCIAPYPSRIDIGEKVEVKEIKRKGTESREEKLKYWKTQYSKCIKCYGCRNICPLCFCPDCILEDRNWVESGKLPPGMMFHLILAYHMADRCVGCGECEMTCPSNIPLRELYELISEDMMELFNYTTGGEVVSPLITNLDDEKKSGLRKETKSE